MSEQNCPEVFKVESGGTSKVIKEGDYLGLESKIKDAANACPVQVIIYDEDWPNAGQNQKNINDKINNLRILSSLKNKD